MTAALAYLLALRLEPEDSIKLQNWESKCFEDHSIKIYIGITKITGTLLTGARPVPSMAG
jgi:hypothetical protein